MTVTAAPNAFMRRAKVAQVPPIRVRVRVRSCKMVRVRVRVRVRSF